MSPSVADILPSHPAPVNGKGLSETTKQYPKPLALSGALKDFAYEDSTSVIGREYPSVNIVNDLLNAENSDALLRDLAITSQYLSFHLID